MNNKIDKNLILEDRLVRTFKALCGVDLLKEDKLYSSNIENSVKTKINKDDEKTINMITIFGLFRNQPPFVNFGDIGKLNTYEELEDLFKKWYNTTLIQLLRSEEFLDDENNAKKYLNAYIKNIKSLGNKAQLFSFKNLEKTLIDVVNAGSPNGQKWIKDDALTSRSTFSIEKPQQSDLIYEDDEIVIVDGASRSKCVRYGRGESWCISQPGHNMFNTYRINHGATIYFVLQKNVKKPENKLVILNYDGKYSIADQTNSGNRAGSPSTTKPWNNVENEIPNLKGKEKYFKHIPITDDERKYHTNVSKRYSDDDIIGYVTESSEGLYLNNALVTPSEFFTDYLVNAVSGKLTNEQFNQIWSRKSDKQILEMVFKYLETGVALDEYQFRIIEKG